MSKLSLFATAIGSRIDAEAGVLRGVSIISKGIAKGHTFLGEPIIVDDVTLDEVAAAAQGFTDGIPVNFDHGTGIEDLVGSIRGVYRDGDKVRGDLYLLKSHESFATILEMAETMPSNFGLSICFMNAPEAVLGADMEPDGDDDDSDLSTLTANDIVAYAARVCELTGADLVKNPATGNGLFQAMTDTPAPEEAPVEEIPAVITPEVVESPEVAPEVPAEKVEETEVEVISEELEVKGPEGTQNLPEDVKPEAPADKVKDAKVPVVVPEEMARLEAINTEFAANKTELSAIRTELASVKSALAVKEAQLVELNMLHRSVKSVLGLMPAEFTPEIASSEPEMSVVERYESMSAGPERLSFFQTNRRELEKAISARLGK